MNLPNRLSFARILAVPVFLFFVLGDRLPVFSERPTLSAVFHIIALLLTIVVTYTDWLDGEIARKQGIITNLGKLLDPLADKIFVTAALIALVEISLVPAWAVVVIVSREFLVTGLRALASEAGRIIPADRLGKHKTGWQLGFIISALTAVAIRDCCRAAGIWDDPMVAHYHAIAMFRVFIWFPLSVTLVLTVWSGWNYIAANRELYREG